jgi:hypothetical protein
MVKNILTLILVLICGIRLLAQESSTGNSIQTLLKVRALQEKKVAFHKLTNGESDGYRVKIFFGTDKTKAKNVQAKFVNDYKGIPAYEEYQQPNFVINVGDFKTKIEAHELLKKIKEEYPYAFIVKSKVRPILLNQ